MCVCDQKARVSRSFVREGGKKVSSLLFLCFISLNLRGTFQSFTIHSDVAIRDDRLPVGCKELACFPQS